MITQAETEAWLETMTPAERRLAEFLARLKPAYRYDLSRFPKIDPPPPPGLPSAIAAAEAIIARIDREWPPPAGARS